MNDPTAAELARSAFDAWNRDDVDGWLDSFHPECEIQAVLALRDRPYLGHAGLRQWRSDIQESFGEFEIEWGEISEQPAGVLALGKIRISGRGSGVELVQPVGYLARLEDGRIKHVRTFLDHDEARRAASEPGRTRANRAPER